MTRSSSSRFVGRVSGVTVICGALAVSAALLTVTGIGPVCPTALTPKLLLSVDTVSKQAGAQPRLHVRPAEGRTQAVALVLHGGKAHSMKPATRRQLSAV